jgi:hypothetical protein
VIPPRRYPAALAGAVCIVALAACGSDDSHKKTDSAVLPQSAPARTDAPKASAAPPVPRPARLRATQSIVADSGAGRPKTTLHVSVTRILDPLHPNSFQAGGLAKGSRYVGVRISIRNVGRSTWTGGPAKASTLLTTSDTQASHGTSVGACADPFAAAAQVTPGERQRGCVVFVLHRKQRAKTFQFSPDAPASPPAEWSLRR